MEGTVCEEMYRVVVSGGAEGVEEGKYGEEIGIQGGSPVEAIPREISACADEKEPFKTAVQDGMSCSTGNRMQS